MSQAYVELDKLVALGNENLEVCHQLRWQDWADYCEAEAQKEIPPSWREWVRHLPDTKNQ